MSDKVHPDPGKMTKKELRRELREARREAERISNISEKHPEGWSGVDPCVNSCTKCGCAATACGCGIAAGCGAGCNIMGGRRRTRRRKRGGDRYIFGFYFIGEERYLVKKKGPKGEEIITEDDGKINLYDYSRVINNQNKMNSWYDKKYNPQGNTEQDKGGAFIRMHQPEGEKKGGRTRREKRKRRRKSTKKKRRRKRTKKKRRRRRRSSRR